MKNQSGTHDQSQKDYLAGIFCKYLKHPKRALTASLGLRHFFFYFLRHSLINIFRQLSIIFFGYYVFRREGNVYITTHWMVLIEFPTNSAVTFIFCANVHECTLSWFKYKITWIDKCMQRSNIDTFPWNLKSQKRVIVSFFSPSIYMCVKHRGSQSQHFQSELILFTCNQRQGQNTNWLTD